VVTLAVVRIGMLRPTIFMVGGRGRVGVGPGTAFIIEFGTGGGFGTGGLPGAKTGGGLMGTGPGVPNRGMTGGPC
jgi:hypothetical protein